MIVIQTLKVKLIIRVSKSREISLIWKMFKSFTIWNSLELSSPKLLIWPLISREFFKSMRKLSRLVFHKVMLKNIKIWNNKFVRLLSFCQIWERSSFLMTILGEKSQLQLRLLNSTNLKTRIFSLNILATKRSGSWKSFKRK